jgi:hypothetical protein
MGRSMRWWPVSSKVLANLTRNQWVGVGLAGLVVAVGGYFLLKKVGLDLGKGLKSLADKTGLTSAANAIGQAGAALTDSSPDASGATWVSWYDPTQRTVLFYYLTFPDGGSHFVGAGSVQSDGTFDYSGTGYRIGNSKAGDLRAYPYEETDFGLIGGGGWN